MQEAQELSAARRIESETDQDVLVKLVDSIPALVAIIGFLRDAY
jgi:hypothetical protein